MDSSGSMDINEALRLNIGHYDFSSVLIKTGVSSEKQLWPKIILRTLQIVHREITWFR